MDDPRVFLRSLFETAVAAASPWDELAAVLPTPPAGRTVVVGAGKAAAVMARAVEQAWGGPLEGLVVTRDGHGVPCERIEVVEAAHPLPDARGREAAARILELARALGPDDLLVALFSGGGSALLALPAPGLSMHDTQAVTAILLRCGASIREMNCVRTHLSAVKGGRLAEAAHPARVATLVVSDVPGDDAAVVASGPTLPDPTTFAEALDVLARYDIEGPAAVVAHLYDGAQGPGRRPPETPKPGDPGFADDLVQVVATAGRALAAAAGAAQAAGVTALVLGGDLEGEARVLAAEHARLALALAHATDGRQAQAALETAVAAGAARPAVLTTPPPAPPFVLLSGGETTVTVRGGGRGGRNGEYLLALAVGLAGAPGVTALACDTDGIDGSEDNAGAVAGPDTLERAARAGVDAEAALAANDAYGFFAALDDLVVTGPTRTNVNDFRAILVT